ncbi:MAG: phosphatase PAP2 family protein [Raoultibacter sp.]
MLAWITSLDFTLLDALQTSCASPALDCLMPFITNAGNMGIIWAFIGCGLLLSPRYRRFGIGIFIALGLSFVLGSLILKPLVGRIRPFEMNPAIQLLIPAPTDSSFPSGHTMAAFAAATVLCFIPRKPLVKIAALAGAALIALSRLYLYVHYPSDVLAGMALGVACGLAAWLIIQRCIPANLELHP